MHGPRGPRTRQRGRGAACPLRANPLAAPPPAGAHAAPRRGRSRVKVWGMTLPRGPVRRGLGALLVAAAALAAPVVQAASGGAGGAGRGGRPAGTPKPRHLPRGDSRPPPPPGGASPPATPPHRGAGGPQQTRPGGGG